MSNRKATPKKTQPAVAPARKKVAVTKDSLKDLAASGAKGKAVKGGANYSRSLSGAY